MGRDWIPFHRDLMTGRHAGVPRGVRFVLLELAILAKPKRGIIELPLGCKSDAHGVFSLIHGKKSEVFEAVRIYSEQLSEENEPTLVFEGPPSARILRMPGWERRAGFGPKEEPGASTARVRAWRERQEKQGDANAAAPPDLANETTTETPETIVATVTVTNETVPCNDHTGQTRQTVQTKQTEGESDARPPASTRVTSAPTVSPEPQPASEPKPTAPPPDEIALSDNEATVLSALRRWTALADLATPKVAREVYGGGRPVPVILRGIAEYGEHIGIERAAGSLEVADGRGLARYMATAAKNIATESYRAEQAPKAALQQPTSGYDWKATSRATHAAREAQRKTQ